MSEILKNDEAFEMAPLAPTADGLDLPAFLVRTQADTETSEAVEEVEYVQTDADVN
jgi:hypothetical protein